jgi:hypothetical protein
MSQWGTVLAASALALVTATPVHAQVQLTMKDGRVTLVAKDVTVRQILAEWARVGETRIVNGERVSGGPVSLELIDVPEKQALDVVLRTISGYLAAARQAPSPTTSRYDRILVLPAPVQVRSMAAPALPAPQPQPRVQPFPVDQDATAPGSIVPGVRPAAVATPPVPVPFAAPPTPGAPAAPATTAPPATVPGLPPVSITPATPPAPATISSPSGVVGTRAPGMIVQPPTPAPASPEAPAPRQF